MKHERGTGGAAPASDAAGLGDARGTLLPARPAASDCVMPRGVLDFLADSRRRGSNSGRFARNRADSGRIGRYRPKPPKRPIQVETADMAEIKKKKKGTERTV